jgi:hypothetical protein
MSVVRSATWRATFRGTAFAVLALMAATTPSSSREPLASSVGVVPEQWPAPATAPKPVRLTCRLYFGCVPAFQPESHLEKENQ